MGLWKLFNLTDDKVIPSVVLLVPLAGNANLPVEGEKHGRYDQTSQSGAGSHMASTAKIQEKIADIVGRPYNTI